MKPSLAFEPEPFSWPLLPEWGSEATRSTHDFIRWVQSSLNQVLGLRRSVNGVMNRATHDALRDFQKQEGLPVDGIAGSETEMALVDTKRN